MRQRALSILILVFVLLFAAGSVVAASVGTWAMVTSNGFFKSVFVMIAYLASVAATSFVAIKIDGVACPDGKKNSLFPDRESGMRGFMIVGWIIFAAAVIVGAWYRW